MRGNLMNISPAYLQSCADQTGYAVGPLEKVVRLGEMAADMARHPFLGQVLALKGGTALNLCFGPPNRLSVDLDFNYVGHLERAQMLADRPRVEAAVIELARRKGYRVQQSADTFAGRKLFLLYPSVAGPAERIEVDLNFLFRLPIAGTSMREMWQPGELDRPAVRVVGLEEVLIGKLLAYLDRNAARDVWDLAHLPTQVRKVMTTDGFRSWFVAFAAILGHPLRTYTRERLETRVTAQIIAEQLIPMVMAGTRADPQTLIDDSWSTVAPFMTLSDNETRYLAAVQNGELHPELLFPADSGEARRMAAHPALAWKLVNVRDHLARKGKKTKQKSSHHNQP